MTALDDLLGQAAERLPGPDFAATERGRAHVLAAFDALAAVAGDAAPSSVATDDAPTLVDDQRGGTPMPVAAPKRNRRRTVTLGLSLAAAAALLVGGVVVAGMQGRSPAPAPSPATASPTPSTLGGVLAFSRGQTLYTSTAGGAPALLARIPLDAAADNVLLAVSPAGDRVAAVPIGPDTQAGEVFIFDVATRASRRLPIPLSRVESVTFSGDGQEVVIAERFATVSVTDRARLIADGASDFVAVQPGGPAVALNKSEGVVLYPGTLAATCEAAECIAGRRLIAPLVGNAIGHLVFGPGPDQPIIYAADGGLKFVSGVAGPESVASLGSAASGIPVAFTTDGSGLLTVTDTGLELVELQRSERSGIPRYTAGTRRVLASHHVRSYLGQGDGAALIDVTTGSTKTVRRLELVPLDGGKPTSVDLDDAVDAVAWSGDSNAG
jgi:hypothetical protein